MKRKGKHRPAPPDREERDDGQAERLQKVLAAAGVGSRRDCEELILAGRVEVDRQVIRQLGTRVDPLRQEIRVDGEALRQPKRLYFAVNKPPGVVSTSFDPSHRQRVIDLVPTDERVFAVGRLDRASEGLILVTNDGEFANRVTHPRYGVEKTYQVRVAGSPNHQQLARLKRGVHLAEGFAKAQSITVKKQHGQSTDLVIVLNEGRNREIRRILARVGHKVLALRRVAVGPIKLGDLEPGAWRRLMPQEIEALLDVAKEKRREARKRKQASPGEGPGEKQAAAGPRREAPAETKTSEPEYRQKAALLSQPLSLDDLLADDLDEGPIVPGELEDGADEAEFSPPRQRGGVIDYGAEEPEPPPRKKPSPGPRGKGPRPNRDRGHAKLESRPREDFGRKRGGKRVLGPPSEGRGPAGELAGNFRFRKKKPRPDQPFEERDERRQGGQGSGRGRGNRKGPGKPKIHGKGRPNTGKGRKKRRGER